MKIQDFFDKQGAIDRTMMYLCERWMDESPYEDFREYAEQIKKEVEALGAYFIQANQKPFGFDFKTEDGEYHYQVFAKGEKWNIEILEFKK